MDGQTGQAQLTFAGHIHELRRRLTLPALMLIIGGTLGYVFHVPIINFIRAPLHQTLYYTSPAGSLNFVMKVCLIMGVTLAVPSLIYSLVSFIEPAVDKAITRKLILTVSMLSLVLGLMGAAFAYWIVLPMSLHFFAGIKLPGVTPLISADDYLNFALMCILTFIVLFQLPLVVLFINHIKPMSPRKLLKYEKYVIVGSFALALILPFTYDPLTQFLIAVPIILLYNLSIIFIVIANRGQRKTAKAAAKVAARAAQAAPTPAEAVPQPIPEPTPVVASQVFEQALAVEPAEVESRQPIIEPAKLAIPVMAAAVEATPTLVQEIPSQPLPHKRVFDVAPGPLQPGNFLDLRPSK